MGIVHFSDICFLIRNIFFHLRGSFLGFQTYKPLPRILKNVFTWKKLQVNRNKNTIFLLNLWIILHFCFKNRFTFKNENNFLKLKFFFFIHTLISWSLYCSMNSCLSDKVRCCNGSCVSVLEQALIVAQALFINRAIIVYPSYCTHVSLLYSKKWFLKI